MAIVKLREGLRVLTDSDLVVCAASTAKVNGQHNDSDDSSELGRFALVCELVKRLLDNMRFRI